MSDQESRSTWARLIAQVYEVNPLECPRCHSPMNVIAVIIEPEEVKKILRHLVKVGPGRAAGHHQDWIRASCNPLSVSSLPAPGD